MQSIYPEHSWNVEDWYYQIKDKTQLFLYRILKELIPENYELEKDYLSATFKYFTTGAIMRWDIFIPRLNVCLEYQAINSLHHHLHDFIKGSQHYYQKHIFSASDFFERVARDEEKKKFCRNLDITLITIPFWWDFKISSIAATIYQVKIVKKWFL
jgi:hypothetical protein